MKIVAVSSVETLTRTLILNLVLHVLILTGVKTNFAVVIS